MQNIAAMTRVLVVVACLVALTACETEGQKEKPAAHSGNNPGALPTDQQDVTPQLNASTYLAHGDLLERQGQFAQAVIQYRKALELAPDLNTARNRLGITLNKLGRHEEATAEFRLALQRTPDAAHVYNNLGFSLYLEGKYQEAARALRQALQLQPDFRRAHMNLGTTLAKMGRFEEALAEFLLAVSEADAHYNLAVMQVEAQLYADAARSLEQALKFNPQMTAARQQLREVARLAAAQPPPPPPPAPPVRGEAPSWGAGDSGRGGGTPGWANAGPGSPQVASRSGSAAAASPPGARPPYTGKYNSAIPSSTIDTRAQGPRLASDVQLAPRPARIVLPGEQEQARTELYRQLVRHGLLPENYADNPAIAGQALFTLVDTLLATSPWTDGTLTRLCELVEHYESQTGANGALRSGYRN